MKNTKKNIVLFCIIIANLLNYKITYAYIEGDLFQKIIRETKGEVVEYGIKTSFKSEINGQELVKIIQNKVDDDIKAKWHIENEKQNYYLKFENENVQGNIVVMTIDNSSLVTMEVIQKSNENNLNELEKSLKVIADYVSDDRKMYYKYLKAEISYDDLLEVNDKVRSLLKNSGTSNINSIELNNGFSTTANTHRYNAKRINGDLVDFNFAICNYSSGKYIILGTPEIIISY